MKKPLNGQLISRNTRIRYLDKKTAWENDWKKVADINFGGDGSIWKKGNKYYYFDIYGFNQNINKNNFWNIIGIRIFNKIDSSCHFNFTIKGY